MKNTLLSALLALGIGLTPGFGFNFMSGSSVDWGHANEDSTKTVENTDPATKSPTAPKSHTALSQHALTAHKSKVASADTSTGQSAK